jgi:hypothetical protein
MSRSARSLAGCADRLGRLLCFAPVFVAVLLLSRPVLAHVPHDVVDDIQVSPGFSVDQQVFATVRGKLFRSGTGGYNWQVLSRGLTCDKHLGALAISPDFLRDRTLVVACSSGGLYRSLDGGAHWRPLESTGDFDFIQVLMSPDFGRDQSLAALTSSGQVWRSADGGDTWGTTPSRELGVSILAWRGSHLAAGSQDGRIVVSENALSGWQEFAWLAPGTEISAILPPTGQGTDRNWYIGTEGTGLIRLGPGGQALPEGALSGMHVTDLASTTKDGALVVFATTWDEAVFRSMDGGLSWQKFDSGLKQDIQADQYGEAHFSKLVIANDSTVIAGGFCGVFISTDVGETWHSLPVALHHITALDVSPVDDGDFAIALATYGGGSITSYDSGVSWQTHNVGLRNPRLGPMAFSPDFTRDGALFTGSFGHVLTSTGRGSAWQSKAIPPKYSLDWLRVEAKRLSRKYGFIKNLLTRSESDLVGAFLFPVSFLFSPDYSQDQTLFAILSPGGLLRSTDKGKTYEVAQDSWSEPIHSIVAAPQGQGPATLFVSRSTGLYRSSDSGDSWVMLEQSSAWGVSQLVLHNGPTGDSQLYAASEEGIFASNDGGESWRQRYQATEGAGLVGTFAISPDFARDRLLLLQHAGGPLQRCIESSQDSLEISCAPMGTIFDFSHLVARDNSSLVGFSPSYAEDGTLYAASAQHLMRSTDRAQTWNEVPITRRFEAEGIIWKWLHLPMNLSGDWAIRSDKRKSGRQSVISAQPGDEFSLRFYGKGVRWIGTHSKSGGRALVFIDGVLVTEVNQYSESVQFHQTSFESRGLGEGIHSIIVRITADDAGTSSGVVDIDAIDVLP